MESYDSHSTASTDRSEQKQWSGAEGMELQSPSQPRPARIVTGWELVNRR